MKEDSPSPVSPGKEDYKRIQEEKGEVERVRSISPFSKIIIVRPIMHIGHIHQG